MFLNFFNLKTTLEKVIFSRLVSSEIQKGHSIESNDSP